MNDTADPTPQSTPDPPPQSGAGDRFVGHTLLVSGLTLISRLTGLVRDSVIVAAFGVSGTTDAFYLAFKIPNLFRRLFGEGALTAAFIPIYTALREDSEQAGRRFAAVVTAALTVLLATITLVGEGLLWWMASAGDWSPEASLTIRLTMVMLPYMPLVCLVALLGGMLQVRDRFGPAASAPILLNLAMIAAAVGFSQTGDGGILLVAGAVVAAGVAQLLWQLAPLWRDRPFAWRSEQSVREPVWRMMRMMGPMVIGLAVFQINTLMDSLIAMALSPKTGSGETLTLFGRTMDYPIAEQGAVASLELAQRLYQFPLGVFGIALATAIFPALSLAAARQRKDEAPSETGSDYATILRNGLRLSLFIALPATAGLMLIRVPLVRVLFEHGKVEIGDSLRTAAILVGYAAGVWAYSLTHVLTRGFYALEDSRTPLRVSMVMLVINLGLNLTLVWPLGAAGLAWSTAACAGGQTIVLIALLARRGQVRIDRALLRGVGRTAALTILMAIAVGALAWWLPSAEVTVSMAILHLTALVGIGAAVYAMGAWASGAEEMRWLLRRRVG